MSVVQAASGLYEREMGPMPNKVSYAEKGTQKTEEVNHTHCVSRWDSPYLQ